MSRRPLPLTLLLLGTLLATAGCGHASPEDLAKKLEAALTSGDLDGTAALAELDRVPPLFRTFYLSQAVDCATNLQCSVSTAPLDEELEAELAGMAEEGYEMPVAPEGLLVVEGRSADGSSSSDLKVPYARIGSAYKVVAPRYTEAALAELRATTNGELVAKLFAAGLYDDDLQEYRTDWATAATRLPPDGGPAGEALRRQTAALATATDRNDPDLAMKSGGKVAAALFADAEWDGTPVPRRSRELRLQSRSLRTLRNVEVDGGYLLGNTAVLIVNARNGLGWIERGAVVVKDFGDDWELAGTETVSYPE